MRINPIGFNIFNRRIAKNTSQGNRLGKIYFDSVYFSGIQKNEQKKRSSKEAGIKVGKEMLKLAESGNLNKESISFLMNANSTHEIEIHSLKEKDDLPRLPGQILGYMEPYYDDNFNFLSANLYLEDFEDINTASKQCDFIANNSHEFAHIIQRSNDKYMSGFLKYFNDMNTYQVISRIGFQSLAQILNIEISQIIQDEEKNKKTTDEIKKGEFDFKKYAIDINPIAQLKQISSVISDKCGYDPLKTEKALFEWIYNTARDEEEAYEVTLAIYDECDCADQNLRKRRVLTKEAYKYVADELQPIINKIRKNG